MQTRTRKITDYEEKLEIAELFSVRRMLERFPTGIFSYVSDTYDLFGLCTKILPKLKTEIMSRDGKLVIRPDSGDPVDIVCGCKYGKDDMNGLYYKESDLFEREGDGDVASLTLSKCGAKPISEAERKGVIEILWEVFGGKINNKGFKELDPHVGCIYGDSITLERAKQICERLKAKGFASNNIVFGVGSYTFNYQSRDSIGLAMKATSAVINGNLVELYKSPKTDDGLKKSARGLLRVDKDPNGDYILKDRCTPEEEKGGELKTVFKDGVLLVDHTLAEIRERLNASN